MTAFQKPHHGSVNETVAFIAALQSNQEPHVSVSAETETGRSYVKVSDFSIPMRIFLCAGCIKMNQYHEFYIYSKSSFKLNKLELFSQEGPFEPHPNPFKHGYRQRPPNGYSFKNSYLLGTFLCERSQLVN